MKQKSSCEKRASEREKQVSELSWHIERGVCVLLAIVTALVIGNLFGISVQAMPPYQDPTLPIPQRVDDLLSRMTLKEKIGQMALVDRQFLRSPEDIREYGLGAILSGGGSVPRENTPDGWADMYDKFQRQALSTRLGIPILYGLDAVHGHNNLKDATIFPHNIGLGATRDPALVEAIARATAQEMVGTGIRWNFAPCLAVPQDIRWGRTYEGFSENPALVAELGAAAVRGYQAGPMDSPTWVLATPKHWIGDGGTERGRDRGDTRLPLEELVRIHGLPYTAAIDAGAQVIMASFSSWNGEKVHGSHKLLTELLREDPRFGFTGLVLSDWGAIYQLPGSRLEQTKKAIMAGIDMVMIPDDYRSFISEMLQLVQMGEIPESRIDEAVRRILTIKFRMGLFEDPFAHRDYQSVIRSEAHLELARSAVQKSLVLLKNEDDVLPIGTKVRHIHITGRLADDIGAQCGGWTLTWQGVRGNVLAGTSIRQAITSAAEERGIRVTYSPTSGGEDQHEADLIIAVIGEEPYAEFKGDRFSLKLSRGEIQLLEDLAQGKAPVVVILLSGRPMVITEQLPLMDAMIAAWLPGTEAQGIADVLFGDVHPSGRLPFTWPRSDEQIPIHLDGDLGRLWTQEEAMAKGYGVTDAEARDLGLDPRELDTLPLFPYGFGLGYDK